jgi:predicted enzyme related to lactoylglutathione lyase
MYSMSLPEKNSMNFDSAVFYTKDLNKAVSFYKELGLSSDYQDDNYASFVFQNSAKLGLKIADEEREVPSHQTIIISVDDIDASYRQLKEKGMTFYTEMAEYDWGRHFSISDPDGNKVEFLQK